MSNLAKFDGLFYDAGAAVFNVMHGAYGAVGDGVTDDTVAIQAAINAAELVNGTVYCPNGTYVLSAQIEIDNPMRLVGESWGTIFTCAAASTFIFFLVQDLTTSTQLEQVVFEDFQIDANASGSFNAGIIQANNAVIRVDNLRMKDGSRASGSSGVNGIACSKANGNVASSGVISNCLLSGFSKPPINVTSGTEEFLIIGNTCKDNTGNGQVPGIQVNGGAGNVKVIGNTVSNSEGTGIFIQVIDLATDEPPINIIVADNTVTGSGTGTAVGHGINFANATSSRAVHAVVTNNVCYNNGLTTSGTGSGINVANIDHVTLIGNRCYGNGIHGIKLDGVKRALVNSNACYNNNQDSLSPVAGITIDGCTDVIINDNDLYDDQGTQTQEYGIYFDAASTDIHISNNKIGPHDVLLIGGTLPTDSFISQKGYLTQTTDATVTTVVAFTLLDPSVVHFSVKTVGRKSDGTQRAGYDEEGLFYRQGGNATLQGSIQQNFEVESDANWNTTTQVSGGTIRQRVTGVAATTINWVTNVELSIAD